MTVKAKAANTNILLESGTNELEIVEFLIGSNIYGINVAKVREIIRYPESVVPVPESHSSLEGIVDLRGKVVPVINLQKHLGISGEMDLKSSYVVVSEFNLSMVGFCVSSVARIHRLSWKQIEPPSGILSREEGCVVAIVKMDDRMILLLDFEKITSDINPESGMRNEAGVDTADVLNKKNDRSSMTVYVVEDSGYIQKIIVNKLKQAGYKVLTASNGLMAWEYMNHITKDSEFRSITDHINIVITDIEMPQMDGLHLIKNIRSHDKLKNLPCVVFSSLISKEMGMKCKSIGADAYISKPELNGLVDLIDGVVFSAAAQSK